MYFSSVFFIFATVFVLVQCRDRILKNDYDYTKAGAKVDCQSIDKTMMSSTCKPHYRHVPLKPMPMQTFLPSVVNVKRCDGNCPGHTCLPLKSEMIKVPIQIINETVYGRKIMCAEVEVQQHTKCRCMCKHKKTDCNQKQDWNVSSCACVCKNEETEKRKCDQKWGMLWNEDECSCNCTKMEILCMSGEEWNPEKCACVPKMSYDYHE